MLYGMNSGPLLAAHCFTQSIDPDRGRDLHPQVRERADWTHAVSAESACLPQDQDRCGDGSEQGGCSELARKPSESKFFLKHYQLWQHHRSIGEFDRSCFGMLDTPRALPHPSRSSGNVGSCDFGGAFANPERWHSFSHDSTGRRRTRSTPLSSGTRRGRRCGRRLPRGRLRLPGRKSSEPRRRSLGPFG